ncbi:MAG TPA: hypothetical protein DIU15_10695 [Deltaproteobacteria bacterium]|nr:hypothetical protein [Deltaproteobacteria bacterium]HCP46504.1 hypothetical protein [Deltaproteobacteria bacterium]
MRLLGPTVALACVLAAGPSFAQDGPEAVPDDPASRAEHHSRLGVEFYEQERYPEAIREMLAAYQAVPDPTLLYNVARIYEAMGQRQLAIDYFTRFVKADDADPDTVQEALEHMAALQGAVRGDPSAAPSNGSTDQEGAEVSDDADTVRVAPPARTGDATTPSKPGPGLHAAVGVPLGLAVGSGVVWGVVGLSAVGLQQRADTQSLDYETRLSAKTAATHLGIAADVAVGVTIGAAATAALVALVAKAQNKPLVVVPVGPRGSLGITLATPFTPPTGVRR